MKNIEEKILIETYRQKEKDIENIIELHERYNKYKHDEKNILSLISELAEKGETEKIKKITQCEELGVDKFFSVLGDTPGAIDDIDMYVILENLIDNAIEAAMKTDNPKLYVLICRTEEKLYFDIGNSVIKGIKEVNIDTQTTKENSMLHGYGLKNIKDVVDKYHGKISFEMQGTDYIMCKVELPITIRVEK